MRHSTLSLALLTSTLALGTLACDDTPAVDPGVGGTNHAGGKGGEGLGGSAGHGGIGGEAGRGGQGGQGGQGGAAACTTWGDCCSKACDRLDNECSAALSCSAVNIQCAQPAGEPVECLLRCIADGDGELCADHQAWLDPASVPSAPSELSQCVAACPGPLQNGTRPSFGAADCAVALCPQETTDCANDPACLQDWFVTCADTCGDRFQLQNYDSSADCWKSCSQNITNANVQALSSCLCNVQNTPNGAGPPAKAWLGTVACSDLVTGMMDACQLGAN
jgi:hypothetical protein